ncbi:MAG: hypothetical protein RIC95_11960 [Vicingaceae bacterium]
MRTVKYIVIGVTLFLFFYAILPQMGADYDLMFTFFLIGNFLVIYMVYSVLRFAEESKGRWNKGDWYDDVDKKYSQSND